MEASAIPASVGLTRTRLAIGAPLLRIRSDEQLVSLFRAGNDEAFRVIHDRYRQRLFVYTRQMLGGSGADAEDVLQEIFVRAYAGLRASHRRLALKAWLYRIAHNRCIDEMRRPHAMATQAVEATAIGSAHDPVARVEQRDALRRLIADVGRLPEQQRSALLMRELGGVAYSDIAGALSVSVPAVKSLLVRARVGLAQASEARDTACTEIRENLILSHDRGVRTSGLARRHMRDCASCRQFRGEVRGVSRQLAALTPTLGPIGVIAKLLGLGGGGGAAAGGISGGGAAAAGGAAGTGAAATAGAFAGAGHVVTLLAAAVVTAGGAIELQKQVSHPSLRSPAHHRTMHPSRSTRAPTANAAVASQPSVATSAQPAAATTPPVVNATPMQATPPTSTVAPVNRPVTSRSRSRSSSRHAPLLISQTADPDNLSYSSYGSTTTSTGDSSASTTDGTTGSATQQAAAGDPSSSSTTSAGATPSGTTGATGASDSTAAASSNSATGNSATGDSAAASGQPTSTSSETSTKTGSTSSSSSGSSSDTSSKASSKPSKGMVAVFTVTSR